MTDIINDINNIINNIKDDKNLILYLQSQLNILYNNINYNSNINIVTIEYNLKLVDWNNVNNL